MLGKEPRKTTKKVQVAGDLLANQVDMVIPSKCVINDNSEELETSHLLTGLSATCNFKLLCGDFLLEWSSIDFVLEAFILNPFARSQR